MRAVSAMPAASIPAPVPEERAMTERRLRDPQPMDESAAGERRASSAHDWLADMRAARRAERAPDDVRERLLERARELGQSVEGHAPSLPLGIEPALSLGLLNERPLNEKLRAGRLLPERRQAERFLTERGPLEAWTHPLLARVAGASLMIGLVVLVIADVRRPSGSVLPAMSAKAEPEPAAVRDDEPSASERALAASFPVASPAASAALSPAASAVVWAPSDVPAAPAMSERAPAAEAPARGGSPSESPDLLAAAPVLGGTGDVRPELSNLAQRVARAMLSSTQLSTEPPTGHLTEAPRPAASLPDVPLPRDVGPPWLSPHAALSAIRTVTMPYLQGAPSFPKGTHVRARGNVRADTRPESGRNLITNGDFSRGDVMWSVRSWQGFGNTSVAAYYSVQAGALCTTLQRDQQVLGGWPWDDRRLSPSSFELERGKSYRVSLRAWSTGPELVQLVVKVGHQKPPYKPALVAKVPITAERGLFDIDFVAARSDTLSGFAFVATGPSDRPVSEFCIDDVSVRPIDADR
jgi:hypothetical protein